MLAVSRAVDAVGGVRRRARGGAVDRALRVTLNFHPERELGGSSVLARLARDGEYRSQFVTGTSNGGLTAYVGGDRWRWEHRMFDGVYDDAHAVDRPTYGALNHRRRGIGGAPRFGSAHLRLAARVLDRTTFCFPDSALEPTDVATADRFDLIGPADAFDGDVLDDYVEAQVHGGVVVGRDVEAVVLDPCFRGSSVEVEAHTLGVPVEWHEGRVLGVDVLAEHADYRGPAIVDVGRRVAVDGQLDAAVIGAAVAQGLEEPQDLKKVWHLVARFGRHREG